MTEHDHTRELLQLVRDDVAEVRDAVRGLDGRLAALERQHAAEVGATTTRRALWPQIVSAAVGLSGVTVAIVSLATR